MEGEIGAGKEEGGFFAAAALAWEMKQAGTGVRMGLPPAGIFGTIKKRDGAAGAISLPA